MSAPVPPIAVAEVFARYPEEPRAQLMAARALIFEEAQACDAGPLTETLKWGEPAYLTGARRGGTTIRLAWSAKAPGPRMLVHCGTNLVERWRAAHPEFRYDGTRAVELPAGPLPEPALRHMIAQALTYHDHDTAFAPVGPAIRRNGAADQCLGNRTYLIEAGPSRWVLRVHRPGYQRRAAIESELAWMTALRDVMAVPEPVAGRDGAMLQGTDPVMVMFDFIPGIAPPDDAPPEIFEELGSIAAKLHRHVQGWTPPEGFERPHWDIDAVFGACAHWGDWRAAPGVDVGTRALLEEAEAKVRAELEVFGTTPDRYGLIHADMRAANLLVEGRDIRLIDFDDCGFGWFLYDFAAAVSFIETRPDLGALKAAWLRGYRRVADLPEADAANARQFCHAPADGAACVDRQPCRGAGAADHGAAFRGRHGGACAALPRV